MVYRGGLENRFGRKPNGGSNPSLSAIEIEMKSKIVNKMTMKMKKPGNKRLRGS